MLEDLTGMDAKTIPLDEPKVMSLFSSTEALGITEEQERSKVATYAIPEFGTKFVRQMLLDTKPTTFGELVRISGLSHGTDVWLNNAQTLIEEGIVTLKEAICTRDDIMTYLISMGLDPGKAFKIMEFVRKGKASKDPETWKGHVETMKAANIPEWFIDSCAKIKYMFPKAHAAAYVTNAFRIAWFKVHIPMAYYTAYFSIRADAFDSEFMIYGKEKVKAKMKECVDEDCEVDEEDEWNTEKNFEVEYDDDTENFLHNKILFNKIKHILNKRRTLCLKLFLF